MKAIHVFVILLVLIMGIAVLIMRMCAVKVEQAAVQGIYHNMKIMDIRIIHQDSLGRHQII